MTTHQKQTIIRSREAGLSYTAIAHELGLSINTVKSFGRRQSKQSIDSGNLDGSQTNAEFHCKQCGKKIAQQPKRKQRRYCSEQCRVLWWRSNKGALSTSRSAKCPSCGREFGAVRGQIYCNHSCYIAARFGGGHREDGQTQAAV